MLYPLPVLLHFVKLEPHGKHQNQTIRTINKKGWNQHKHADTTITIVMSNLHCQVGCCLQQRRGKKKRIKELSAYCQQWKHQYFFSSFLFCSSSKQLFHLRFKKSHNKNLAQLYFINKKYNILFNKNNSDKLEVFNSKTLKRIL